MAVTTFDHIGVVVEDLDAAAQFFVDLGFDREEPVEIGGQWMDRVVGLEGVRAELVVVAAPDGSGALELTKFHEPTQFPRRWRPYDMTMRLVLTGRHVPS